MSNPAYIQKGQQLRVEAMKLIWRFDWLRPQELGLLLWPNSKSATTQGRNFGQKILDEGLVIDRKLPLGAGTAYVLSTKGARLLNDNIQDGKAKTGKDWGKTVERKLPLDGGPAYVLTTKGAKLLNDNIQDGKAKIVKAVEKKFLPPLDWIHDLNANTFLITLKNKYKNAKIWNEREIKRNYKNADFFGKIPDGMFTINNRTYLLEGERTGKRGKELENMIAGSDKVFSGQCKNIFNKDPSGVIFLVLSDTHIASILRKFAEFRRKNEENFYILNDLEYIITFAIPVFDGFAVRDFSLERYSMNGPSLHHELDDVKWLKEKIQELRRKNLMPQDRHVPFFRYPNKYAKF